MHTALHHKSRIVRAGLMLPGLIIVKGQAEVFWLDAAQEESFWCGEVRPQEKSVYLEKGLWVEWL